MKNKFLRSVLVLIALDFSSHALASPKLSCADQMSFRYGRIEVVDDGASLTVFLRGHESHGRTVSDLQRDLNITFASKLNWVAVRFPKSSCIWADQTRPVGSCIAPLDSGEVIFYSGWELDELKEIARAKAEVTFTLDQFSLNTVAPGGYFRANAEPQTLEETRGSIYVSSNNGKLVYRSLVSVGMLASECR